MAVNRDDVLTDLERLGERVRVDRSVVVLAIALEGRDLNAVDIDLGVLVVIDVREHIFRIGDILGGQFDGATHPNVARIPLRANNGAGGAFRSESGFALFPSGVVEVGGVPGVGGLIERILPRLRLVRRAADDDLRLDGGTAEFLVRNAHLFRRVLDHFAVVGHEAVDFDFNVGRLRIDGGGKPLRDQRTHGEV